MYAQSLTPLLTYFQRNLYQSTPLDVLASSIASPAPLPSALITLMNKNQVQERPSTTRVVRLVDSKRVAIFTSPPSKRRDFVLASWVNEAGRKSPLIVGLIQDKQ